MKKIDEIYQKYEARLDLLSGPGTGFSALNFGPAHIVWEDHNFEDRHIEYCIRHAQEHRAKLTDAELELVLESLQELLTMPEHIRLLEGDMNYEPTQAWTFDRDNASIVDPDRNLIADVRQFFRNDPHSGEKFWQNGMLIAAAPRMARLLLSTLRNESCEISSEQIEKVLKEAGVLS